MGLWEGDGHRSPSLCIVLPESALLAETHTDWHSAMSGRTHLCPESSGNLGRTRAGTGMTLVRSKEVHLRFAKQIPDLGYRLTVQHPFPRARASVLTENRPPGSVLPEREPPSKRGTCLGTKGEDGAQACPGCVHIVRPDYNMMPPENGEKILQSQEDSPEFQAVYMPKEELFLPLSTCRPSFEDILTPLWRKTGSRHINRCQQQLRDTLIRRVAGTVGCNLSSFIHKRNGLMWSSPRGNTGEAAAIRPNSLRQVPTETWWPSLKRAKHAVKTGIRAGAKRACIWTESKRTPRNTVRWDGRSTLFLAFILRPREWMWPRTISLWRLTSSLEWARMSQSSR